MRTLKEILKEYYDANQLSKSINVLEIALVEDIASDKLKLTKCICDYFVPTVGWGENVEKAFTETEQCYYCRQRINSINREFKFNSKQSYIPSPLCAECRHCYVFVAKEFIKPMSDFKLVPRKKRRKCRAK